MSEREKTAAAGQAEEAQPAEELADTDLEQVAGGGVVADIVDGTKSAYDAVNNFKFDGL